MQLISADHHSQSPNTVSMDNQQTLTLDSPNNPLSAHPDANSGHQSSGGNKRKRWSRWDAPNASSSADDDDDDDPEWKKRKQEIRQQFADRRKKEEEIGKKRLQEIEQQFADRRKKWQEIEQELDEMTKMSQKREQEFADRRKKTQEEDQQLEDMMKSLQESKQELQELEQQMIRSTTPHLHGEYRIRIKHLPPSVDDDGLRTLFSPFGEIRWTTSITGGRAALSFANHQQAQNAIDNMNGRLLDGSTCPLGVCFYGTSPDPNPHPPPPPPPPPAPPRVVVVYVLIHHPPQR